MAGGTFELRESGVHYEVSGDGVWCEVEEGVGPYYTRAAVRDIIHVLVSMRQRGNLSSKRRRGSTNVGQ